MFQTIDYAILVIICFSVTWLLKERQRTRIILLLAASYFLFLKINAAHPYHTLYPKDYPVPKLVFLSFLLLFFSSTLDYFIGRKLEEETIPRNRKGLLFVSVAINIGILGIFKYFDFFVTEFCAIVGIDHTSNFHLFFPIGISFYTFQTISYSVDVYRGHIKPTKSYLTYQLYIAFFPQLIMGPIVRAKTLIPQLEKIPKLDSETGSEALARIGIGIVKKLAIADFLRIQIVDPVFTNPTMYSSLETMTAIYAYTFQIYADFSGYTDIAIGTALLFGISLPENFNAPYKSRDLREFWGRWHITLSQWLRDYLYIPLGGSRKSEGRTYVNLMITMILGGLWHGAAETFLIWGTIHGAGLVVNHMMVKHPIPSIGLPDFIKNTVRVIFTFHLVTFAWIFFRATSLQSAGTIVSTLFDFDSGTENISWGVIAALTAAALSQFAPKHYFERLLSGYKNLPAPAQAILLIVSIYLARTVASTQVSSFIYAKF